MFWILLVLYAGGTVFSVDLYFDIFCRILSDSDDPSGGD